MDNLIDQKVLSVETWTAAPSYPLYEIVYPIQVRMKSGDTFATITSSASGDITGGSTTTTPAVGSITGGSLSETGNHSHLSTGAIVGIAIGSFFAIALVVAGILFFVNKSRRLRKRGDNSGAEPPIGQTAVEYAKAELPAPGPESSVIRHELPDNTAKG